jgi:hypothetical protein
MRNPCMPPATDSEQQQVLALLANPISEIVRLDTRLDFEYRLGPEESESRQTVTLHPTLPLPLNGRWRLVADLDVPLISQEEEGVGDLMQTSYLVPARRNGGDFTWGIGSAIRLGTAATEQLGTGAWGAGPSFSLVQYDDRLVSGLAISQIWGDGGSDIASIEAFTTWIGVRHSVRLKLDVDYEHRSHTTTAPLSVEVSRLIDSDARVFNLTAGARYYVDIAENLGPWGLHFSITCAPRN